MDQRWNKLLNAERLRPSQREHNGDPRTEFESDYGRVIFSPAIRRMHDKTQVFPLTTDDNIHSRLTHSMEVMSIGYSLGLQLAESIKFKKETGIDKENILRNIPVILQSACLVHDIGNPPFGHFGESVIQQYFSNKFSYKSETSKFSLTELEEQDFTCFDGNAQGFRVLTKLQSLNDTFGLNLTFATLASYLKYPNAEKIDKTRLHKKKRGVFQSEKEYLKKVMDGCGLTAKGEYIRHPLAYLMEAADSICYLVMDIEDGYNKHWYDYDFLKKVLSDLPDMKAVFEANDKLNGYGAEVAKIVNLRLAMIKKLIRIAIVNFENSFESILSGTYDKELIFDDKTEFAKSLRQFCINNIFCKQEIQSLELTGHSVITGLLDYYIDFLFSSSENYQRRAEGLISTSVKRAASLENNLDETRNISSLNDYYKLRIIVDFISGMTDQFALNHYQKLNGQKIS